MHGIRWLWKDQFALGKLGLIGGLPDKGKGLISAYMAGCVTTVNLEWPCGEGKAPQGNVIWFTAEDDIGDTVKPRLVAVGADLDRVHIMQMIKNPNGGERMFNLATDLPALEAKIDQIGDVQLVLIDPVTSYLGVGKLNTSSTTDVRGILGPLVKLAERKQVAIVGIMHFNKKADVTNAMLRIADSLAYVAAARHVYVVVDDAENTHMRLFVKAKNNLAPDKYALRYGVNVKVVGRDEELGVDIVAPFVVLERPPCRDHRDTSHGGRRRPAKRTSPKDRRRVPVRTTRGRPGAQDIHRGRRRGHRHSPSHPSTRPATAQSEGVQGTGDKGRKMALEAAGPRGGLNEHLEHLLYISNT